MLDGREHTALAFLGALLVLGALSLVFLAVVLSA